METKRLIPSYVCKEAKEYVKSVIANLEANGLLEVVDLASIQMLAVNYDIFIKASKEVSKNGLTVITDRNNVAANPLIKVAKDAQVVALKIMSEFGLMLKSRTKISAIKTISEESPLDVFLKGEESEE